MDDNIKVYGHKIKTRKHYWKRNLSGEIDEMAWDYEFCNGPSCMICYKTFCVHCAEVYGDLQDEYNEETCKEHFICSVCGRPISENVMLCDCGAIM